MNIKSIRAFPIDLSRTRKKQPAAYVRQDRPVEDRASRRDAATPAGPLEHYPQLIGHLVPNDAPGFGMEIDQSWLEEVTL